MKIGFILCIFFSMLTVYSQNLGTGSSAHHSATIDASGKVHTWGLNLDGQLGNGNTLNSNVPINISNSGALSGKTIVQVSTGENHTIALTADGIVIAWGKNDVGQLGTGSFDNSTVPIAVNTSGVLSGKTITKIAAGGFHNLALSSDGLLYCWGIGTHGELGNGNTITSNLPVAVTMNGALNGKSISEITAGGYHSIVVAADGTV